MRQRIIYEADGVLQIVVPNPDAGMTIQQIAAAVVPPGADFHIVDVSRIPDDRAFRNAWKKQGSTVITDMGLARGIHRDAMRAARAPLLADLDAQYMRALEANDTAAMAAIAAEKQALRDVTADPAIDGAVTPEDLIAVWPPNLPSRPGRP